MTLRGRDEPMFAGLDRLLRWCQALYRRRRRAREQGCLRCGSPASATCTACGARVCDRCWLLSIETGAVSLLCVDCVSPPTSARRTFASYPKAAELFRGGLRTLGAMAAAMLALSYWQHGWTGPQQVVLGLLNPAVTFALVPLAFFLGAVRVALGRLLRAFLNARAARAR